MAFWPEAFGLELPLAECESDAGDMIKVIGEALDEINDWTSPTDLIHAAQVIIVNRESFKLGYADCKAAGVNFVKGTHQMDPFLDTEVLAHSIKMAELHHPISFNSNLIKFRNAFKAGDYASAGKYAGKDMAYLIEELPEDETNILGQINPSARDLEQFLDNFWYYSMGIEMNLEGCVDNGKIAIEVIRKAVYLITDHSSILQVTLAIKYIKEHTEEFRLALIYCGKAGPQLVSGAKQLYPLTDTDAAYKAARKSYIWHPIAFPKNMRKGRKAIAKACLCYYYSA